MSTVEPRCEISIVSGANPQLTFDCLESLQDELDGGRCRAIVTLNPGTDEMHRRLRQEFPDVAVIRNPDQRGFAHNHNVVLEGATAEYIWVLNDDTVIQPGAVETLLSYMDAHPRVGMATPRLLNPDGSLQRTIYAAPTTLSIVVWVLGLRRLLDLPIGRRSLGERLGAAGVRRFRYSAFGPHPEGKVQRIRGAAMFVRRAALDRAGLIDEINQIYEEIEWQRRFEIGGWEIHHVPEARIEHLGSVTTGAAPGRTYQSTRQLLNDAVKHFGAVPSAVIRVAIVLGGGWRWARGLLTRSREQRLIGREMIGVGFDRDLDRHGRRFFARRPGPD